jgi:hypothetical protein
VSMLWLPRAARQRAGCPVSVNLVCDLGMARLFGPPTGVGLAPEGLRRTRHEAGPGRRWGARSN